MSTLGDRIKQLRLRANLNKATLARKIGVSDVTISYWETGAIKQIGHERLVALANVLGSPLNQLLGSDTHAEHLPLYLHGSPPAPWQTPYANRGALSKDALSGVEWQGDCYLVTPAPGEHFEYLENGDLAAFAATEQCDQPGRYLIEGDEGLYLGQLQHSESGELLCSRTECETEPVLLEASEKVVGRLLARWRRESM